MRARHTAHSTPSFPVYSAAFLSPGELILGGGGGASKTGIKNKLRLYHVDEYLTLKLADEHQLGSGEDAPMSMAAHPDGTSFVCGINSTVEKVEKGENLNCRVYAVSDDDKIGFVSSIGTLGKDPEDFQKVTVFSPDGTYLAVAGSHELSLLTIPELISTNTRIDKGEIYDASFSETTLVVATTVNLLVYNLPGSRKGKEKESKVLKLESASVIERPKLPGGDTGTFRVAKHHPHNSRIFYTVLNTTPPRGAKAAQRKGFLIRWNAEEWKVERIRKVGVKPLTAFDLSDNGKWIAYGSSDCSVGLLDALTLAPLLNILKSHEFPPTVLKFNPTSRLLLSGSADNTVRLIAIPEGLGDSSPWSYTFAIILALFSVLFAVTLQLYMRGTL
ncbi:WD40 repeat-like protein [Multifurca ochricompacta]|uniref:WD40 repeat-like protein n=1 Tax=Multifurca ochricompacta TaxID=376703 RepID=A0AAD4MAT8_9AGAM|nr:WD40 repeat-like protein [Multifurca ochricompacta]